MSSGVVEIAAVWIPKDPKEAGRLMDEMAPLLQAYWNEARPAHYGPFCFDVESFVRAWALRSLVLVQYRIDRILVGFAFVWIVPHLFTCEKTANATTVYLAPAARRQGLVHQGLRYLRQLCAALQVPHVYLVSARALARLKEHHV